MVLHQAHEEGRQHHGYQVARGHHNSPTEQPYDREDKGWKKNSAERKDSQTTERLQDIQLHR